MLFACALTPCSLDAQASPPGVFSEIQTAFVSRPNFVLEPATLRTRVVQVDTQKIAAARRGREFLKLNLFDDATVEVQIKRIRPTRSGYFIFGTPKGVDWGEVRLVVNGPVMVGTVETPKGKFTIRSGGPGRHVIREIDRSKEAFECGVEDAPLPSTPPLPARPENAISSIDPLPSGAFPSPTPQADNIPTEDGSEVRVLIVFTPAMQAEQGGAAGMQALIDLYIQTANQAFEDSGINPRLVLAHSVMADYVEQSTHADLRHLINPEDGYMDEVHTLRNKYAADLVHLLARIKGGGAAGSAGRLFSESLFREDYAAFGISTNSAATFAHEIGHNFGLRHDRYVNSPISAIYPYAFGYVNKRALEPGAPETARWTTLMAYVNRCADAGLRCPRLLRYSNPDQSHMGDPLGVSADSTTSGVDGPADARLTINSTARWVGSFRSEACSDFTVSGETQIASVNGGEVIIKVQAGPGCLWDAASRSEILTVGSDARSAGPGFVRVEVQPNRTGAERSGTFAVAGALVTVRQLATDKGICGRTSAVIRAIARGASCEDITAEDLARIGTLGLSGEGLTSLRAGDFEGMSGLTRLSLGSNQLTELPQGLFADLASLTSLSLGYNLLTELPSGLFAGLSKLERLRLESNRLRKLPGGIFAGLSSLKTIELGYNDLAFLPPELFAGLSHLEEIDLISNELAELPESIFAGLSSLKELNLRINRLTELPNGLFLGLVSLEQLDLGSSQIASLPANIFAGLSGLKRLDLSQSSFSTMPVGVFSDLSNLEVLSFWDSQLNELPVGAFSGLSKLLELNLHTSRLVELPSGLFSGLSNLQRLFIGANFFTSMPPDIFSGLSQLQEINLNSSQLTSMPNGIFVGLTALEKLYLDEGVLGPIPLPLSLEKTGDSRFKAVAPTGAPSAIRVPITVSSAGEIERAASALVIPAGAQESAPVAVLRADGAKEAVNLDIGTPPDLPTDHLGYAYAKDESLPLWVLPSLLASDANLINLTLSEGTLIPVFSADTMNYTSLVAHGVTMVALTPTTSNADATVTYLNANDRNLPDIDAIMEGHQVSLRVGENTIKVRVTSNDATQMQSYTLVLTRDGAGNVCGRTEQVREAIVDAVAIVAACTAVTEAHLSRINFLRLAEKNITRLKSRDFEGLTSLRILDLGSNELIELPADILLGLTALNSLHLQYNQFRSLPETVFTGRTALRELSLYGNQLGSLPDGVFSDLSSLRRLNLTNNRLFSMPRGIFSSLMSLEVLSLGRNSFRSLPADLFSGLTALQELDLGDGRLSSLPGTVFMGLTALEDLNLYRNQLSSLPDGIFSGLTELESLYLQQNTVDPLQLPISLTKIGDDQFKAIAPSGAPFTLDLLVSISSTGAIEGGASAVTIPAGAVESSLLRVTRVAGTEDAVSVSVDTLPSLPDKHQGYVLEKDETLPREILPGPKAPPPAQVVGVAVTPSVEQLDVSWTAVPNAGGYKVQWKSGAEEYEETRQAVIPGGETVSYTLTRLAEGAEYTIRVIATKEQADDGLPSEEVMCVPRAVPAAQVKGVEVTSGLEELDVSWTAVSDASGYEVQWKSGEEDYDERRQAVLDGGETVSHTISGLISGTEYVIRVIATKQHADDGLPSDEVTGVPRAVPPVQVTGVEVTSGVEQLDVSWTVVSDASGYKVQWKSGTEDYDEQRQAVLDGGALDSYTIVGLTAGAEYTVRVIATREYADEGLPSEEVTGTPRSIRPAQIMGVEVATGLEELDVSWTAVSDASGYKVQWKSGIEDYDEARQAVLDGGAAVSYTIPGLTAGADYTVRVIATKQDTDDGLPSEEATGTPIASAPAQVRGVEVALSVEQLEVLWTVVPDADGYKVEWKSDEDDYDDTRQAVLTGGDAVSYTLAGLTSGTEYTVRVIATKAHADDGMPSDEVTGVPKADPPPQVTGVEVTPDIDRLQVLWTAVPNSSGFKVQWKSGVEDYDEARQAVITGGDTVSYAIEGLTGGAEYTVRVIATKANADDGPPSDEVAAIPRAMPPAQVAGVEVTAGVDELAVSWTAVSDADGYKVQWKFGTEDYDGGRQVALLGGDTINYTIIDLTADTEYTIRVIATKDHAEDGPPSEEVTGTPTSPDPDVNGDGMLDGEDAQVMYQAYASAEKVGDGETGGTAALRQTLLSGLAGTDDPTDDDLKAMLRKANVWRMVGVAHGGDINEDGEIDQSDAFVMYYAYDFADLVGDGETGGTARHRRLLLSSRSNQDDPTDEDLKKMLRRANQLREDFG